MDPRRSSGRLQRIPVHSASACGAIRKVSSWHGSRRSHVAPARHLRPALHGLLFWVLSIVIAWRGGVGPVILASIIAVVFRDFILTSPGPHRGGRTAIEIFSIITYLGVSATLGYTTERCGARDAA